jgi:hypothetical protein
MQKSKDKAKHQCAQSGRKVSFNRLYSKSKTARQSLNSSKIGVLKKAESQKSLGGRQRKSIMNKKDLKKYLKKREDSINSSKDSVYYKMLNRAISDNSLRKIRF